MRFSEGIRITNIFFEIDLNVRVRYFFIFEEVVNTLPSIFDRLKHTYSLDSYTFILCRSCTVLIYLSAKVFSALGLNYCTKISFLHS